MSFFSSKRSASNPPDPSGRGSRLGPQRLAEFATRRPGRVLAVWGYEVVAVCREQSVGKLAEFEDRISIAPGATDGDEVIERAVAGCDGVLVVRPQACCALGAWGDGARSARPR